MTIEHIQKACASAVHVQHGSYSRLSLAMLLHHQFGSTFTPKLLKAYGTILGKR